MVSPLYPSKTGSLYIFQDCVMPWLRELHSFCSSVKLLCSDLTCQLKADAGFCRHSKTHSSSACSSSFAVYSVLFSCELNLLQHLSVLYTTHSLYLISLNCINNKNPENTVCSATCMDCSTGTSLVILFIFMYFNLDISYTCCLSSESSPSVLEHITMRGPPRDSKGQLPVLQKSYVPVSIMHSNFHYS